MRIFRSKSLLLASLVLGLSSFNATAQAAELKIGVVSVPRLLQESPQGKATMEALQREFEPKQRVIVAKEKEYQEKGERIQRDLQVMSEAERRNAEKDLREDQREIVRLRNEFVEDQNLRRNEEISTLQRSLLQQIDAFARAGAYDLIIGDGVLFANSAANVTDQVLAAMQADFDAKNK